MSGVGLTLQEQLLEAGKKSVREGIAFARKNYPPNIQPTALGILMAELAKDDFDSIKQVLSELHNDSERAAAVALVADYWVTQNYHELLKYADKSLDTAAKNIVYEYTVEALIKRKQFQDAAEVLKGIPFSASRASAINSLGYQYGVADGGYAIKWLLSLKLPEEVAAASAAVLRGMASSGNVSAMQQFLEQAPASQRPLIEFEIGRTAGIGGLKEIDNQIGDLSKADVVISGLIETLPSNELAAMSERVFAMKNSTAQMQSVATMAARLFESGVQNVITWINSCPGDLQAVAIQGLVSKWYNVDSEALSDWINSLPKGGAKDAALETLTWQLHVSDPKAAKDAASAIQDSGRRNRAFQMLKQR
jgi:hypothetical protein